MPRSTLAAALLLMMQYTQLLQEEVASLDSSILLLCSAMTAVVGSVAAMSSMHAHRRLLGTPHVVNTGQYETVKRMMDENPHQFYELFRMTPQTFIFLRDKMWSSMPTGHHAILV